MDAKLTSLDWVVIVAAAVALIVLVTWTIQGSPIPALRKRTEAA